MRAEIAEAELRAIREAGVERIYFAWAGAIDPARPHYYRLHGPTVLIEYDNSQNNANHIHSVWHDPRNGFGADLLRAHYRPATTTPENAGARAPARVRLRDRCLELTFQSAEPRKPIIIAV